MEYDLWYQTTFGERQKKTFPGRQHSMEYILQWKKNFTEDNLKRKTTSDDES